jgi:ribulose-5-phosphate 4-epimerase/fuculose-1-phosphate aldolase
VTALDPREWELRVELAACCRVFAHLGLYEMLFDRITMRLPGSEDRFLLTPPGLPYGEVTASNLAAGALDGEAFAVQRTIYRRDPLARCIIHTHTTAGLAVASSKRGLVPTNFYSVAVAGDTRALISREHGVVAHGPTIPDAFEMHYRVQRACDVQIATETVDEGLPIGQDIIDGVKRLRGKGLERAEREWVATPAARRIFDAMVRLVDAKDPSYRT